MAGNIVKIKEGHYRLRYRDASRNVKAKNDSAAEVMLAKFITEIDSGDYRQPSKMTFGEFVKKWEKEYASVHLAPMTLYRYKIMLDNKIIPEFGDKRLEKIKPLDLLGFYSSLRKDGARNDKVKVGDELVKRSGGLSDQTIKHHHRVICAIFEKAIKWGVLHGQNPAKAIDAPKVEKKKAKCYNESQVKKLLETLGKEELKYQAVTMIALMTGARLGEIMGLEWQDIDDENKMISIRQASQYLPGQGTFTKDPKNETSKRKISVNDTLLNLLKSYKEDQQKKGFICGDNNRLFITWNGKPMPPHTISKWFPDFIEANKLPKLHFHGLRHTSATFLISHGMDIETVASRLGHSTSSTTQNIYSHFLESKDRKAARLMEITFNPKKKKDKPSKSVQKKKSV